MTEAIPGEDLTGDNPLVGTWRLVACELENAATGERENDWGEHPIGYLVVTPSGRWIALQTAKGRKVPQTDEDRAAAFRSLLAYSGRYRTNGREIVISVDIAWEESWVGTEQVRFYRLEGDKLHIEAPPQPFANFGGKVMRAFLTWERER